MFGLSRSLDDLVRIGCEELWLELKSKWFCQTQTCKIPGLLKIEKQTETGSFIALSPKAYLLGEEKNWKRSLEGCPDAVHVTFTEFLNTLYDCSHQCVKSYHKLQFDKRPSTICLQKISKRVLNSVYTKYHVSDNGVICTPHM